AAVIRILTDPAGPSQPTQAATQAGALGQKASSVQDLLSVATGDEVTRHVLAVACGLDSMVMGECQIVRQIREAFRAAEAAGVMGPVLGQLLRVALRTSKRARTETAIGAAGRSMASVGLDVAAQRLGGLAGRPGLLIGAGKMGAMAAGLLRDAGVSPLAVANRTRSRACELATRMSGTAVDFSGIAGAIAAADLVVSCTDAPGHIVDEDQVAQAILNRASRTVAPLVCVDLALPRDIDPKVRDLPNVTVIDIDDIGAYLQGCGAVGDVETVWSMVDDAVAEFQGWRRERARVTRVISELRAAADGLVESEVRRVVRRLPQLDQRSQREVETAVRRAVGKLLHTPTVRVRELAAGAEGPRYVEALATLFDLESEVTQ
ncbi:MAG: glutamyl-tRNA reductase, partial [Micromonosporaceae bacterium]|nr:glutamyl-tRNA reductase [Micromonosporaceae bacterium]